MEERAATAEPAAAGPADSASPCCGRAPPAPTVDSGATITLGAKGAKGIGGKAGSNDGVDGVAQNTLEVQ